MIVKTKPMTFNNAYPTSRSGRRFMTAEAKAYKAAISIMARSSFPALIGTTAPIKMRLIVFGPLLTRKGELSMTKPDLDGCIKLIQDAICDGLGIKDHLVIAGEQEQCLADEWGFEVTLEPWTLRRYGSTSDHRAPIH